MATVVAGRWVVGGGSEEMAPVAHEKVAGGGRAHQRSAHRRARIVSLNDRSMQFIRTRVSFRKLRIGKIINPNMIHMD